MNTIEATVFAKYCMKLAQNDFLNKKSAGFEYELCLVRN